MTYFIENVLHLLVDTIGVDDTDSQIMKSISSQLKRGIALTDRQYNLMMDKIGNYKTQLESYNIKYEGELPTRLPLRTIDRSKTIGIVTHSEMLGPDKLYETYKQNYLWIRVRFPFSKKLIAKLDSIKPVKILNNYYHIKGSNEHFFRLNGHVVIKIVDTFKNSNFKIEDDLMDYYYKSKEISKNRDQYIFQFKHDQFLNIPVKANDSLPDYNNNLIVADRRIRFGYKTDIVETENSLVEKIAFRKSQVVNADPKIYSLQELADAMQQLDRFPILVLIDTEDSFKQLEDIHTAFHFVDNSLQSVLFRVDNDDSKNVQLNQYVKDQNINNWVDSKTKIVYIKKTHLPKIMFTSGFKPITAFSISSYRSHSHVSAFCKFNCDLVIYHDKESSFFNSSFGSYNYD